MDINKRLLCGALLLAGTVTAAVELQAGPGKFDKLSNDDRKAFGERFQKEIWPLLSRNGKDGCVGCHNGKKVTSLHLSGDATKDFNMLVGDGYLLRKDPGSVLERIIDKDRKRRMPPDDRPPWSEAEIKLLRQFVDDLDKKNKL